MIVPNIDLSGERIPKMKLKKARGKNGKLKICKLSDFELHQVRYVLESLPFNLLKSDTKPTILETGYSISATGFRYDFVEGNIVRL